MPTFHLIGTGVNGRHDSLEIEAATEMLAIAQATGFGFKVAKVRITGLATDDPLSQPLPPGQHATLGHYKDLSIAGLDSRLVAVLEQVAQSKLIRQPVWTICWGVVLSSVALAIMAVLAALTINILTNIANANP